MEALARRAAPPVFALAMFSSAALIFMLQPLFGRMVTPLLGGSPAVWNVSMAFFQAALLLGYLYAHLLARLKDLRLQAIIHALVLVAAWAVLPVRVSAALGAPSSDHPAFWLVGVLALSVGAPFAAISATAPLLQSWYARTGRADAHDPYYLYAASNLGSFLGLLAYPAIIEPLFGLHAQSLDWTAGYIGAAALIVFAAAVTLTTNPAIAEAQQARSPSPSAQQRLFWMAAAAIPSALILAVTLHITTDVASAPFLWVVPLALYLATFVIAFARGSEKLTPIAEVIWPIAFIVLIASYFSRTNWPATLGGNLFGFFMSALVCHLALARSRPPADRLTEFYFFVSLGGVLGGAFAAFVAPVIFNDVYEYPLALAGAALFLRRGETLNPRPAAAAFVAPLFMALVVITLRWIEAYEVVLIAGALGAAAAMIAAAWGEETIIPPYRYGFLLSAIAISLVLAALFVLSFILHVQIAFNPAVEAGHDVLNIAQPWGWLIAVPAGCIVLFATHAAMQPRKQGTLIADYLLGVALPSMVLLLALCMLRERLDPHHVTTFALTFAVLAFLFNFRRPLVLAALVLISFVIIFIDDISGEHVIAQERTFFGILRVHALDLPYQRRTVQLRILMHGTTLHGAQLHDPVLARKPLTYYNPDTALGEAILAGLSGGDHSNLALIGLGTGTTACLTRPSDQLDIFEIDPAVVRLSTTPNGEFVYVPECQPHARVHLGDARLQIAQQPDGKFDVIVVDAFSSDAIPAHLLTEQAIALYLRKTSDRGIVVLHLSNRNLALVSESARVAHVLGAPSLFLETPNLQDPIVPFYGGMGAEVMIIAKSPAILSHLPLASLGWRVMPAPPGRPWSDDYINLPRALWESLDGAESCRINPPETIDPHMAQGEKDSILERARQCRERLGG